MAVDTLALTQIRKILKNNFFSELYENFSVKTVKELMHIRVKIQYFFLYNFRFHELEFFFIGDARKK